MIGSSQCQLHSIEEVLFFFTNWIKPTMVAQSDYIQTSNKISSMKEKPHFRKPQFKKAYIRRPLIRRLMALEAMALRFALADKT